MGKQISSKKVSTLRMPKKQSLKSAVAMIAGILKIPATTVIHVGEEALLKRAITDIDFSACTNLKTTKWSIFLLSRIDKTGLFQAVQAFYLSTKRLFF